MRITVRYYGFISSLTKKIHEEMTLPESCTLQDLIDRLAARYGYKFRDLCFIKPLYSDRFYCNANLNSRDINDKKSYPDGLDTVLKDGDTVSFGVISGAA
ncbi:MAG: MoaD/ThiS family protein [Peptococcaceae bacterium]|nr:MoaD/ThiS family protein [Peptococcaceae bacterium]